MAGQHLPAGAPMDQSDKILTKLDALRTEIREDFKEIRADLKQTREEISAVKIQAVRADSYVQQLKDREERDREAKAKESAETKREIAAVSERVGKIERAWSWWAGALAVITALVSSALSWVVSRLGK